MDFSQRIRVVIGRWLVFLVIQTILACWSVAGNTTVNYTNCTIGKTDRGFCVKRELCENEVIDTTGGDIIGPRFNGGCDKFDEVCCRAPESESDSSEDTITPTMSSEEPNVQYDPNWSRQCGQRTNVSERTDSENETNRFEFPWNVAIFSVTQTGPRLTKKFIGGGILIDEYFVITAARFVQQEKRDNLRVELGKWDLDVTKESQTQELSVDEVFVHQNFVASSLVNNIALLYLKTGAQLGRSANRVCLAEGSQKLYADSLCHVVGWRLLEYPDINRQLKLRSSFLSEPECSSSIQRATTSMKYKMVKENICVTYLDAATPCERAPGTGLFCESTTTEGQYFLVGIASFSVRNCNQFRVPDVFLNIPDYVAWVDGHVVNKQREKSFYRPEPTSFDET
ncbi:phenoloxidase-activating factor 2-like [Anopheles funestus]|uniref:phenoloxidase-activating factor 2-like n=1 Tax=Anopheles funestus TaxID=62324 RepID=UPI0020C5EBD2|nr:phenoloxidase-activating factor 2-like [Anopheles funestus]